MKITKGLTSTGNIVAETPKYLFDRISSIFNFSLDVCALPENAKCESYYTPEDDGLSKPWRGGYGATLPMEEKSCYGSGKPMRSRRRNTTTSYSCYCQQEQIQNGGGSMCMARRRSSSSREE